MLCRFLQLNKRCLSNQRLAITSTEFVERRQRIIGCVKEQTSNISSNKPIVVVLHAPSRQFCAPDVPYSFRQCSYFRYFTGLVEPDSVLMITAEPGKKSLSTLYINR